MFRDVPSDQCVSEEISKPNHASLPFRSPRRAAQGRAPTLCKGKHENTIDMAIVRVAMTSRGEDMQKYLSDTQKMARQGKHQEALERFLWFHDHALEHEPAMYGVRLSFALDYWKSLADVYPPAKSALVETRDHKEETVLNQEGNAALFHDVVALNRTLGEDERTVELFETIDRDSPDTARQYWDVAKDAVIEAMRYDLVRKYIGNPSREFIKVKAMYDHDTTLYDDPRIGGDQFKAYNENNLVEESLKLIKVALALDDMQAAKDIQKKALTVVQDYRLRDAVPEADKEDAQH